MSKKAVTISSTNQSIESKKLVAYLAHLAQIPLSPELEGALVQTLPDVLQFVEQIKSLPLAKVEKTYRTTEEENVMREDIVTPSISQTEALKNASASFDGYFLVPRILEND